MQNHGAGDSRLLEDFETLTRPRRMARWGKKLAIAAVLCLLLVLCGLECWPNGKEMDKQPQGTQTPAPAVAFSASSDALESITVAMPGEAYTLVRTENKTYTILHAENFPIRQSVAQLLWMQCASIPVQQVFELPDDAAAMGLENEETYLTIRLKDGTEQRLLLGFSAPTGGRYARMEGGKQGYVLSDHVADTLITPMNKLHVLDMPAFAMISAPASITIENRKQDERWEIVKTSFRVSSSGYEVTKPHVLADAGEMAALIEDISKLQVISYAGKQSTLDWGPIEYTITETDGMGNELRYAIGRHRDADNVFFTMDDEDVYLLQPRQIAFLDALRAETLTDRFLCLISLDQIQELSLERKNQSDSWFIQPTEGVWKLNGQQADEALFRQFFSYLSSLTVDRVLEEESMSTEISWEGSLTCYGIDGTELHRIRFAPYDHNYDLVSRSEDLLVLVEKGKLEKLYQLCAGQ